MEDTTQYVWTPPPDLVAQSNLTAFLRVTGQQDYDDLASNAEANPVWLMEEVFKFCDVRFYRHYDTMLDLAHGQPAALPTLS
jgi:acetyl-CoA synthetase